MENPFVYGEVVPAASFVDRIDELDRLVRDLASGQKVFLISPRRYGKSSLIRQALRAVSRGGALTAEATVSSYSSYLAFLEGYTRSLLAMQSGWDKARSWIKDAIGAAKPELRLEADSTGAMRSNFQLSAPIATSRGLPPTSSRCPAAWPICARRALSSHSTSFRLSTDSTGAASSTRCARRCSISAASDTSLPAQSPV
jgi:hypothetical protein